MMHDQTYIVVFIFAGLALAGLMALGVAVWYFFMIGITPTPKPTDWEAKWKDDWEEVEHNLSK